MEPRDTTFGDSGSSWIKRIVVASDGSPARVRRGDGIAWTAWVMAILTVVVGGRLVYGQRTRLKTA
jgi:hypothetical protein